MGHESTRALLVPFTQRLDQRKPHRIVGERADQPAMGEAAAVAMGMANAQRQNDRAIVGFRIKRLLRIGQRTGAKVTLVAFGHLFGAGHPLSSQPLHAAPNHKPPRTMNGPPTNTAIPKISLGTTCEPGLMIPSMIGKSVKKPVQRPEGIKIRSPITSKAIVTASEGRLAGSGIGAFP
jgi:hypothetical protein